MATNPIANVLANDAIDGAETLQLLQVDTDELNLPQMLDKVTKIVEYFKGAPDKRFVMQRVIAANSSMNRVELFSEYISLRSEYEATKERVEQLGQTLGRLEGAL